MLGLDRTAADFPFMIGAQEVRPVVAERRFRRPANLLSSPTCCGAPLHDVGRAIEPAGRRSDRRPRGDVLREYEPADADVPDAVG